MIKNHSKEILMLKYLFFKSIVLFLFSYIVIEGFIEDLF